MGSHPFLGRKWNTAYDYYDIDEAERNRKAKKREHRLARRAMQRNAEGKFTEAEWQSILKQHDHRCAQCGTGENLTIDHIVPLSRGGSNWPDNLQPLCSPCNNSKGNRE